MTMKISELIRAGLLAAVVSMCLALTSCDPPGPTTPPRAEELPTAPFKGGAPGAPSDQTMDHNGATSGNSDPARRE